MKMKKLDQNQYKVIKDDNIIYLTREQNPGTEHYLYIITIFKNYNNDDVYDNEVFDDFNLALDYVKDNYDMEVQKMSEYFVNKCIKCKEEHKPKLIKMGKYWAEIQDWDELCEWCVFGLDYNNGSVYEK